MTTVTTPAEASHFPPGPTDPPAQQLAAFTADPFGAVTDMARRYGSVFTLRLEDLGNGPRDGVTANGRWVFLTRPHQIRAMYEAEAISGADANRIFFGTDEDSVGYVDGAVHRDRRSRLQPVLSGGRDHTPVIEEVTARRVAGWPSGEPFPLYLELQQLTAEIITELVCGGLEPSDKQWIRETILRTENAELGPEEAGAAEQAVKGRVLERLEAAAAGCPHAGGDIMGELAGPGPDGGSWSATTVRDEVFSLLYTGFSTTSNTLSWVLAELMAAPDVMAAARAEADAGFRPGLGHREAAAALPYLDAVIRETLRLHPVSALNGVRMVTAPIELDGHRIPAGTILVHCAHLAQRSPDVFDEPDRFRPERFLSGPVDPYDVATFGGGSRTCVGRIFALREMRTVLAMILRAAELDGPREVPPARQEGIFMAPADRVRATVTPRGGVS